MIQTKGLIAFFVLSIMALTAIVCWLLSFAYDDLRFRRVSFIYLLTTVTPWITGILLLTRD